MGSGCFDQLAMYSILLASGVLPFHPGLSLPYWCSVLRMLLFVDDKCLVGLRERGIHGGNKKDYPAVVHGPTRSALSLVPMWERD